MRWKSSQPLSLCPVCQHDDKLKFVEIIEGEVGLAAVICGSNATLFTSSLISASESTTSKMYSNLFVMLTQRMLLSYRLPSAIIP